MSHIWDIERDTLYSEQKNLKGVFFYERICSGKWLYGICEWKIYVVRRRGRLQGIYDGRVAWRGGVPLQYSWAFFCFKVPGKMILVIPDTKIENSQ